MTPRPFQLRGVTAVLDAINRGVHRICLTAPTGAGKSMMMAMLVKTFLDRGERVILFTNRRLLLEQSSKVFGGFELEHGVIAAGMTNESFYPFQIASIQTIISRMKNPDYQLPDARLVLIDELHVNAADKMQDVIALYVDRGAVMVGVTATPIDIGHVADELIVACTTSEARECGALVPAVHYGIEEPDCRKLKVPLGTDLSEQTIRKIMGAPKIVGRVIENYRRLNPEEKPTILFASGVSESLFFAEQFTKAGHRAAHIDGECIWLDGEQYPTTPELRQKVLDESRTGRISVVCNRFVLREGIDAPWLQHGILATVYGSLQSYLQSGGRMLRNAGAGEAVTIQDHGGNWWRHGDLNADREWYLDFNSSMYAALRDDRLRDGKETEPFRCPDCAMIVTGKRCPCGFEFRSWRRSRPVMQLDGRLVEMEGSVVKQHRVYEYKDGPELWAQIVKYRAQVTDKATGEVRNRSYRECAAQFGRDCLERGRGFCYPRRDWPGMPKNALDWYRAVNDVPLGDRL